MANSTKCGNVVEGKGGNKLYRGTIVKTHGE